MGNLHREYDQSVRSEHREFIKTRLSAFYNKFAVISVGGASKLERNWTRDLLVDAINSTTNAKEGGVVAGGGAVFVHFSKLLNYYKTQDLEEKCAAEIFRSALLFPFKSILQNSGRESAKILEDLYQSEDPNRGFCVRSREIGDMVERGVVDSARNVEYGVADAVGVACLVMASGGMVVEREYYQPPELKEFKREMF